MNLSMGGDCVEAARNLYGMLHALDGGGSIAGLRLRRCRDVGWARL